MAKDDLGKSIDLSEYEALVGEAVEKSSAPELEPTESAEDTPDYLVRIPEYRPPHSSVSGKIFFLLVGVELLLLISWGLLVTVKVSPADPTAAVAGLKARYGEDFRIVAGSEQFISLASTINNIESEKLDQIVEFYNNGMRTEHDGFGDEYQDEDFDPGYFELVDGALVYFEE